MRWLKVCGSSIHGLAHGGFARFAPGKVVGRLERASGGLSALYGFIARQPNVLNTLANSYGLYVEKQKATNVTTGWGVFQADAGDQNQFAGPVIFKPVAIASLPTCNAGLAGARMAVNNGVASPTFQAVVSTTGAATQPVFCNGANWIYN